MTEKMNKLIVLSITLLLLTGCGGGFVKNIFKIFQKSTSKQYIYKNKYITNDFPVRIPPSTLRCIPKYIQHKNCDNSNTTSSERLKNSNFKYSDLKLSMKKKI